MKNYNLKSISINFKSQKALVFWGAFFLLLQACSVGYYGDKVGEDVKRYRLLQEEYNRLESDYIVILENLTLSPNDDFLINERNRVSAEMLQIKNDLDLAHQLKVKALRGLEDEVVRKQTEEIFADSMKTDARKRLEKQLQKKGINLNLME